jgi:TRAP-type mannitol/chloroaromatic compound transport system permease small subunit
MTGVMVAGVLSSANLADPNNIHAYYDTFFLMASIFLFTAAYTIHKEHHKIKVF